MCMVSSLGTIYNVTQGKWSFDVTTCLINLTEGINEVAGVVRILGSNFPVFVRAFIVGVVDRKRLIY